uniref:SET domain-containing protein n=1 Tax=Trichogramma kaykai TaxID=54128 RepID=A0ABD2WPS5_9HYME
MNYYLLCNLDDLAKNILVDSRGKFNVRKMKPNRTLPFQVNVTSVSKRINEDFDVNQDINETTSNLMKFVKEYKLHRSYSIQKLDTLKLYFKQYLKFLHKDSFVELSKCDRFSRDNFNGVSIKATRDINKDTILKYVIGIFKKIPKSEEHIVTNEKLNFSLLYTSRTNSTHVLLGPISFVNHDCHPNTEYHFRTSYSLQLKVIKNIKKGEEILVKYSDDYFGPNNEDCECTSCLNKSR